MLKHYFFLIITFGTGLIVCGQDNKYDDYALYFTQAQPSDVEDLEKIPVSFRGEFISQNDTLKSLVITEDSVYMAFSEFALLPMKAVRESEHLVFKDSLLYGIYPDRPVPAILKNDTLVYVMYDYKVLCKAGSLNKIRSVGEDEFLIINYPVEGGFWNSLLISIEGNKLRLLKVDCFDKSSFFKNLEGIKEKKVNGYPSWVISFTNNELLDFINESGFNDETIYTLRK